MRIALALFFSLTAFTANAQQNDPQNQPLRDRAKWLLERLTSVKWSGDSAVLSQVMNKLQSGDKQGAAELATAQAQFLDVTVREMAAKMSTREESVRERLNDFTATIVGVTRDQTDAREILFGNFIYKGDQAKLAGMNVPDDILRDNNHYNEIARLNVSLKDVLVRVNGQQVPVSATDAVPSPDPAGVLTSRAFMAAHAIAGTNRRLVEYTFREFMCLPIQEWADTSAFESRVGRDIDRAPGGDQQRYLTTCKGCHTVMDGFRGAFARWDFRGQDSATGFAVHTITGATENAYMAPVEGSNGILRKMNRPEFIQYAGGYVTTDDSFVNHANRSGSANALRFGWREPAPDNDPALSGRTAGVHAFGRLVAGSRRFTQCMAKRVWDSVCKYDLPAADMELVFTGLGMQFETDGFNLKKLFEAVSIHPKCRFEGGV